SCFIIMQSLVQREEPVGHCARGDRLTGGRKAVREEAAGSSEKRRNGLSHPAPSRREARPARPRLAWRRPGPTGGGPRGAGAAFELLMMDVGMGADRFAGHNRVAGAGRV